MKIKVINKVGLLLFLIQLSPCTTALSAVGVVNYVAPCSEDAPYCLDRVLEKVQMSGIFNDSKEFVDMPLRQNWTYHIEQEILNTTDQQQLKNKLDQYFYKAGTREWHPENISDWKENPGTLFFEPKILKASQKLLGLFLYINWFKGINTSNLKKTHLM